MSSYWKEAEVFSPNPWLPHAVRMCDGDRPGMRDGKSPRGPCALDRVNACLSETTEIYDGGAHELAGLDQRGPEVEIKSTAPGALRL